MASTADYCSSKEEQRESEAAELQEGRETITVYERTETEERFYFGICHLLFRLISALVTFLNPVFERGLGY